MKAKLALRHGVLLTALGAYVYGMAASGIRCPVWFLTHVPCPFCGMTRAWLAALRLDFAAAFSYHPLFLLAPALLFLAIHRSAPPFGCLRSKGADFLLYGLIGAFLLVWLARL